MRTLLGMIVVLACAGTGWAADLPEFPDDAAADRWLRDTSAAYRRMAADIDARGGFTIRRENAVKGGMAYFKDGRGVIELNDRLKGAERVSVLIFEVTNLFQEHRHQAVADRVRRGELEQPAVFALLREAIEYDGLRLHREVLQDLNTALGDVPPAMFAWVVTGVKTFAEYREPFVYDYLQAQAQSGHTEHYIQLYKKHRAEYEATRSKP